MNSTSSFVRRYLHLLALPPLALAAWLSAKGIADVAAFTALSTARATVDRSPRSPLLAPPPVAEKSAEQVLRRNPFDSSVGPLVENDAPIPPSPYHAPPCDDLRVVVIAASSDSDWSFAALTMGDAPAVLRRRGGDVGGQRVEYVAADRVFLRSERGLCQAELWGPRAKGPRSVEVHPPTRATEGGLDPRIASGIVRVSPTEFKIERSVVDRILENQVELMKGGNVLPEKEGERVTGLRLVGVRPDRLLGVLGLANGDVLKTLNGYEMSNPEKMLEAYARLRDVPHLVLEIVRANRPMTFDYRIE